MSARQRVLGVALAGFVAVVSMSVLAGGASATPDNGKPPPGHNCPNPHGKYPPGQCKTKTSASSAHAGSAVIVEGSGYSSSAPIAISLGSSVMTVLRTDSVGNFSGSVQIPRNQAPGTYVLAVKDVKTGWVAQQKFTSLPAVQAVSVSRSSDLPFSGFILWPTVGAGVVLLLAGSGLMVAGRRRRLMAPV